MNQPFTQVYLKRSIPLLLATVGKVCCYLLKLRRPLIRLLHIHVFFVQSKGRVITIIFSIVDSVDISGLRYISYLQLEVVGLIPRDWIRDC